MGKALETVNRFYDTTENKKGKGLENILAKDMTFIGPLMKDLRSRRIHQLDKAVSSDAQGYKDAETV